MMHGDVALAANKRIMMHEDVAVAAKSYRGYVGSQLKGCQWKLKLNTEKKIYG
jgi:hypothetical protein